MSRGATARLFIALELPEDVCEELASWARSAARQACAAARFAGGAAADGSAGADARRRRAPRKDGIRLLEAGTMHLTLCFLGSRPVEEVDDLASLVESLAMPLGGSASLGAPLWLPPRRPRALAVEVHDDSGTLSSLHRSLVESLRSAGLAQREREHGAGRRRALRPHVTVARLRAGAAPRERALPATPQRSFPARSVVLCRSWLGPEGASYEALARSEASPPRERVDVTERESPNNCSVRSGG